MRSGPEAVEAEEFGNSSCKFLGGKGKQKELWRDESEHWSERRSFMKLCSAPQESREVC